MNKIKVMIVDDSALVRQMLTALLNRDPGIEVIATASDPVFASRKIAHEKPDVITLDMEMPRMNGITFLERLMDQFPIPVVVISSLTARGSELSLKALDAGAVEVIAKPRMVNEQFFEESAILITDAVKAAAQTRPHRNHNRNFSRIEPRLTADSVIQLTKNAVTIRNTTEKIIVAGASTGGTTAIQTFLSALPADCPGIVIVQHMPELFTRAFADRLDKICRVTVKEAVHGEQVTPGKALIAPGNKHLLINRSGARYTVEVNEGPLVNRHRPSVDVLFRSAAKYAGPNAMGLIMTGMGDDGARGLLEMRQAGAYTVAQDEASCIVYGMPKAAVALDAASVILPLDRIASHMVLKVKALSEL